MWKSLIIFTAVACNVSTTCVKDLCPNPNEVYDECPAPCPPRRCDVDERVIRCAGPPKPSDCKPGCRCADGYFKNSKGVCVTRDQCDSCPRPNEVYDVCPAPCPPQKCGVDITSILCAPSPKPGDKACVPGCRCIEGYVKNNENACIPKDQCPKCTKPNEFYDPCPPTYPPQTCESLDKAYSCARGNETTECYGACRCNPGFYRNKLGECISEENCRKCSGPNEYFSCGGACDNVCATLSVQNQTSCPIINIKCNDMCYCEEGYARDEKNICIPIEQCKVPVCNTNEVYDGCANSGCRRRSCSEPKSCLYPYICEGGCVCKENYTRADNGTCIPESQCGLQCNKPNEYLDNCPITCPPQTCDSIGRNYHCPIQATVCRQPDCRCKKGYYRNTNGDCVTEKECKKCTGPHEYFACGGACDNVCATINKQNQTNCPIINIKCNPMCYCEKGYARDENGICIPIEQCPASCGGDRNATSGCGNNCIRCSNYKEKNIACTLSCLLNGCDCKDGYVYDDNRKKCVLPEDCSKIICGLNEVYNPCSFNCPPNTCESIGKVYACPIKESDSCQERCVCKPGYYRNSIGICVTEDQCSKCRGPNEFFACGGACDNVCATLHKQNRTNCPILNIKCNPMCYCKDGYARNTDNICIPIKECPGTQCGRNEIYVENPASLCEPLSCSELGLPLDCSTTDNCRNKPNCICRKGFVRNSLGICVKKSECPSCGGDRNAVAGCGVNCGNTCSTYGRNDTQCIQACFPNACDCRKGFVYDEVINRCVLYKNCRPVSNNTSPTTTSQPSPLPVTQPPQSSSNVNVTEAKAKLDQGCVALSHEFIYQMSQTNPDDNFVVSAASVLIPLSQLALFAVGSVFTALTKVLNIDSKDEIKSVYLLETPNYANQQNVEFELATKYYANQNYPLSDAFKSDSKKYFNASGENIDFSNNVAAADTINTWVEERTHDRIKDLISADTLNENTVAVLVNAIYFLGNWVHQFNPDYTEKRNFTKRNGNVVQLDTMYQENRFSYGEVKNLNLQCLEMQYKNFNFSMFIILPKAGYFDDAIKTLRNDREAFNRIRDSMRYEKVQVYLPKMEINTNVPLEDLLKKAGLSSIFDPGSDGFKGILANDRSLYVSGAIQKAFMKSDEKGTEATAATAIMVSLTSAVIEPPQIYEFKVNRPALFYILFQGVPHFCGVFAGST